MEAASVIATTDPARTPPAPRSLAVWMTVALPLTAIVVLAAIVWGALGLLSPTPWIFPDELIYAEIAKNLAEGGLPSVRDTTTADYGLVYPLLLAPVFALSPDTETAYAAARMLNAVVMSLAAVPAYFLARRFVERRSALAVAAFSVFLPSMAYVGTLLTEVALYPAFLLSVLALTRAVERPTWRAEALALGSIVLVFLIKPFGVVLLAIYCAAAVLYAVLERDRRPIRASLASYRLTWAALVVAAVGGTAFGTVVAGDPALRATLTQLERSGGSPGISRRSPFT
jgi:4-amino-4-deoxy-L-arabinose transferase-like glycosyltransferase